MNLEYSVQIIVVVAVVTLATRVTPFLIFGGKKEVPAVITYLGRVLPPAIMAMLVVYCLKGVKLLQGSHGLPEIMASLLVVGLHLWKKNTLLSIGMGTVCYMILVQCVFV